MKLSVTLAILAALLSVAGSIGCWAARPALFRHCREIPPEVLERVGELPDGDPVFEWFYRYSVDCGWVE